MKLRRLLHFHAPLLAMTPTQALELAKILGQDDAAFAAMGRGPGGGPDATPYNMALIVLAALANGPQTRARAVAQTLYNMPVAGSEAEGGLVDPAAPLVLPEPRGCPLTGAGAFGDAVRLLLADPAAVLSVSHVEVRRGHLAATIHAPGRPESRFASIEAERGVAAADDRGEMRVTASISGAALAEIARDLAE